MDIMIFDAGKYIGIARTNKDIAEGSIMETLVININGKDIDVLHVRDMDYGIIIPPHISKMIDDALEENRS